MNLHNRTSLHCIRLSAKLHFSSPSFFIPSLYEAIRCTNIPDVVLIFVPQSESLCNIDGSIKVLTLTFCGLLIKVYGLGYSLGVLLSVMCVTSSMSSYSPCTIVFALVVIIQSCRMSSSIHAYCTQHATINV